MPFAILPDRAISPSLTERISATLGNRVITYPSGRAWVISAEDEPWSELRVSPSARILTLSAEKIDLFYENLIGREVDSPPWDRVARDVSLHSFFIGCADGTTRAQGNLSTSRQLFWTEIEGEPIASDSLAALKTLAGAGVDRGKIALTLAKSMPILPFAERTAWSGVHAAGIGQWLRFGRSGPARAERWWSPEEGPKLQLREAGDAVRAALREVLGEATRSENLVSADLSGGLDSTSICYALAHLGQKFRTFRTSSASPWNDETERAREAAEDLGVDLFEFPPLAETSTAFAMGSEADPALLAEGPVVWSASRGYLDVLAPAISEAGSRVHFTGLGGDELFDIVPGVYRSVWSEQGLRAWRGLRRFQLSNKVPARSFVDGVRDRRSYQRYLRAVAADVAAGVPPKARDSYSWFPPPALPIWLSEHGRALVADTFDEAVARAPAPLGADPAAHQTVESIAFQGNILRQFGVAFARHGIAWEAPFTDRRLVEAVLRATVTLRMNDRTDKPLLAETVSPFMPRRVFAKRGRGDFTADVYAEHHRRKEDLIQQFATSRLADLGLIDLRKLRPYLESPSLADAGLLELENVIVAERWLRNAA